MDGIGYKESDYGNAVSIAQTPQLDWLQKNSLYRTLYAHGTHVGLPSDSDLGNSEVGHNALGAGRIFDQGAKLVQNAIDSGTLYQGKNWKKAVSNIEASDESVLHFIGLLSDGNIHAHENHLYAMLRQAKKDGVSKVSVHVLFDGRDVSAKSAEKYLGHLNAVLKELNDTRFHGQIVSGGGRMYMTMDRYGADWPMVKRGWDVYVKGQADHEFESVDSAMKYLREEDGRIDQLLPSFVITKDSKAISTVKDGDSVIFFNFRGDRSIEISRAFDEKDLDTFDRGRIPDAFYAGMMEYDGDMHIPSNYLVEPPSIDGTLGEYLVSKGLRQFACSETQKYGHVTFFWNGNKSEKFSEELEEWLEIPSDNISFDEKPWMKAYEITEATIERMHKGSFDFARINYPNGDMVGHTGNLEASIVAIETVDLCVAKLIKAADETDTILVITADHGNADEMFDTKEEGPADWLQLPIDQRPKPKTSHTLSKVPLFIYDPRGHASYDLNDKSDLGIANIAATVLELMEVEPQERFLESIVKVKK